MIGGAHIEGPYRYNLVRKVGPGERTVLFVMLNPSTADAEQDDPTIRRCIGFARAWGFDILTVCNLFAYRATNPTDLRASLDPVGPRNDSFLGAHAEEAELVVAAWGSWDGAEARAADVSRALRKIKPLHALQLTKNGSPSHPLYLRGDLKPFVWDGGAEEPKTHQATSSEPFRTRELEPEKKGPKR